MTTVKIPTSIVGTELVLRCLRESILCQIIKAFRRLGTKFAMVRSNNLFLYLIIIIFIISFTSQDGKCVTNIV